MNIEQKEINEKILAMRKVDDMLTETWLNALLCTNHYYPTRIMDMQTAEDFSKWKLYLERLK